MFLKKFSEYERLLRGAKVVLEREKNIKKDYYVILGVNKTASRDDIIRAYRKKAKIHHPGMKICKLFLFTCMYKIPIE